MFKDIVNPVKDTPDEVIAGCVEIYDDVIVDPEYFIIVAESMGQWRDADVYEYSGGEHGVVDKSYRSNVILDVNYDEYSAHPIFTYMNDMVKEYLYNYSQRYEVGFAYVENTQLLRYSAGQEYKKHFDTGPDFPRVISALLYVNDVEEGGETRFVYFDEAVKPKAGRLVIFPSNYAYTHEAKPPTNGSKYVFVFWTREWDNKV